MVLKFSEMVGLPKLSTNYEADQLKRFAPFSKDKLASNFPFSCFFASSQMGESKFEDGRRVKKFLD